MNLHKNDKVTFPEYNCLLKSNKLSTGSGIYNRNFADRKGVKPF